MWSCIGIPLARSIFSPNLQSLTFLTFLHLYHCHWVSQHQSKLLHQLNSCGTPAQMLLWTKVERMGVGEIWVLGTSALLDTSSLLFLCFKGCQCYLLLAHLRCSFPQCTLKCNSEIVTVYLGFGLGFLGFFLCFIISILLSGLCFAKQWIWSFMQQM